MVLPIVLNQSIYLAFLLAQVCISHRSKLIISAYFKIYSILLKLLIFQFVPKILRYTFTKYLKQVENLGVFFHEKTSLYKPTLFMFF